MESEMKCEKCGAPMEMKDGVMTCTACGHTMPAAGEMSHDMPAEEAAM